MQSHAAPALTVAKRLCQGVLLGWLVAGLVGCGPASHLPEFKTWLSKDLGAKGPFRIVTLQGSGGQSMDFGFRGEVEVTDNLYRQIPVVDTGKLEQLRKRAHLAKLSAEKIQSFDTSLVSITETPFCERLATTGQIFEISGWAKVGSGEGTFELVSLDGLDVLHGQRLQHGWMDRSGEEGNKRLLAAESQSMADLKAFEAAIVTKELELHSKGVQKTSLLLGCRPGSKFHGVWKTGISQGSLGIEFTKQGTEEEGFPVEGFLFDPVASEYRKPFRGQIVDSENDSNPWELRLTVSAEEGGVPVHDEILNHRSKSERAGLINKTLGLLLIQCDYTFTLKGSSQGKLVGNILENDTSNRLWIVGATPVLEFQSQMPRVGAIETLTHTDASGTTAIKSTYVIKGRIGLPPPAMPAKAPPPASPGNPLLERVIQLATAAEPMMLQLSEAMSRGDKIEANKIFQEMVRRYPDAPQTLALRISQAHSLGNSRGALQLFQKLESYPLPESTKSEMRQIGEMIRQKK